MAAHRNARAASTPKVPSSSSQGLETSRARTIAEWALTILLYLFVTTTLVQAYVIPTSSMENTILIGDHVLVDKLAYSPAGSAERSLLPYREVQRGDIIVFRYPLGLDENYVKRAIGLPGDRLRIENKQVILNGRVLNEPYVIHKTNFIDPYRDNFPSAPNSQLPARALEMLARHVRDSEVVVPPGHFFALGDNRDQSSDSRYWGFVPRENIVGTPLFIYWSYDAPTDRLLNPSFGHVMDLALNFFTKTRWERTFQRPKSYRIE